MNRFIVLFSLSIIISASNCKKVSTTTTKPNILIINIDDLGWRDFGCMGSEFYNTPNIDQLAKQGMLFTNGYASAANCAPSRACLMTGQWPQRHGIYTVGSSERGKAKDRKLIPTPNTQYLDSNQWIIPKFLKSEGYTTCHAGKWHLSNDPTRYGFDQNIGGSRAGHPRSYYPPYKNVDLKAEQGEYLTDLVMTHAIDFVQSAQQPFFLYYAPYAVHTPIQGVDSLKEKYQNKPAWNKQQNIDYATMIENLDRNIGRLLRALSDQNTLENTFIVLTSDNGGLYGITYQLPLRAGKGSYYEGGIRVPFLFVWNNHIPADVSNDTPVSNLDIFPTLVELLAKEADSPTLDGQSLMPLLTGKETWEPRPLFWHFPIYLQAYDVNDNQNRDALFRTRPGSVIRQGNWKLHHYFEDNGLELYNLTEDLSEQKNLAKENPEKVKELYARLDAWRKETNAPVPTELNPAYEGE